MEAVVGPEEDFFSVLGDEESLGLAGVGAVISVCVKADCAGPKVRTFVTAVEGFFPAAFDVRADAALADRGERTTVIVGPAGAAPLPEEAVITRKAAVRDRINAFAGGGDQGVFNLCAPLDPGAVIAVFGIKSAALERLAREILAVAAEGLAFGDRARRDVAVAVKGISSGRDTAAAVTGLFECASIAVEAAIGSHFRLFHRALSFFFPRIFGKRARPVRGGKMIFSS